MTRETLLRDAIESLLDSGESPRELLAHIARHYDRLALATDLPHEERQAAYRRANLTWQAFYRA